MIINRILKRLFDIVSSGILIVLLIPLWIIVSIAIKLDSKGPVFFKQGRRTKDGKIFNELVKGDKTRRQFFEEILDVLATLGGDHTNVK